MTRSRQTLNKKNMQPLHTQKITQPLQLKNHSTHKHGKNCKTLPWENHIGCQMCKITLSKSTEKNNNNKKNNNKKSYSSDSKDSSYSSVKNSATSKNNMLFFSFSSLLERAIWHIWQPIWCSQGIVLQFSFLPIFTRYALFPPIPSLKLKHRLYSTYTLEK